MWFLIVFIGLWLMVVVDRVLRTRRQESAIARRRWLEYAETAERNAERWRTR
jgi:hypothetical protein